MDKDLSDSVSENSANSRESDTEKSFVGKFKSHVSEIINSTPLSKWFRRPRSQEDGDEEAANGSSRSTIRRRDDSFEDEEIFSMQPPSKRPKRPSESHNIDNNYNQLLTAPPVALPPTAQPSQSKPFTNFSEPVAGPSGIQSRKLLSRTPASASAEVNSKSRGGFNAPEFTNGHHHHHHHHHNKDSDSEESTSGYSSVARIGSKEQVCGSRESSKQTSPLENSPTNSRSLFREKAASATMNRSLFAEPSISPNLNSSLSSRRPSFNASTFGSPNFVDKTLSTRRILNSPFYTGRTIYGGASAYGKTLGRSIQDLRQNLRPSVTINPRFHKSNESLLESSNIVMGKTARRILDTLEQYNSPVNDAKKIPVASKKPRLDGILSKYTGANPYLVRDKHVASNRELQVPSVTDLLKLKQRERLQNSTESVRQMATSTKSALNIPAKPQTYQLAKNDNKPKHSSKIKSNIASVRQKSAQIEETVEDVPLPAVSLPITNLPKFDLKIPPPTSATSVAKPSALQTTITKSNLSFGDKSNFSAPVKSSELLKNKQTEFISNIKSTKNASSDNCDVVKYKFSKPLVIAENLKNIVAINNFKFSKPLVIKPNKQLGNDINFKMPEAKTPVLKQKSSDKITSSNELKTSGSVLDILSKTTNGPSLAEKFKPAQGTWECSICLVRNNAEKTKCVACETPKSKPVQSDVKNGFGSQFFLSGNKWECQSCLVRNDNNVSSCVACTTPKSGASVDQNKSKPIVSSFGDKFKPPSDTWECTSCMVRNKVEVEKCVACETPKAGSKATKPMEMNKLFKPPTDTWECPSCMIRNKNTVSKCEACETPKSNNLAGFGGEFKIKSNEWECSSCMVRNKADSASCQCCQAANPNKKSSNSATDAPAAASAFKFGIPASAQKESASNAAADNIKSIFGAEHTASSAATPPTTTFSFGIKSNTETKTTLTVAKDNSSVNEKKIEAPKSTVDANKTTAPALSAPTFNFGSKSEATTTKSDTQKVGFSFGAPALAPKESSTTVSANATQATTNKPSFAFGSSSGGNNSLSTTAPSGFNFKSTTTTTEGVSTKSNVVSNTDTWTCTKCQAQVANGLSYCSTCNTFKGGVPPFTPSSLTSLGDKFKPDPNTWACGSCMIRNKNELDKCAACETPKPASASAPSFGAGKSLCSAYAFNTNSSQPQNATESKPVFQFGSKPAEQPTIFGAAATNQTNNIVKPTPTFGAAASTTTAQPQQSTFSFSSNATAQQQKPFGFGSASQSASNDGEPPSKIPSFSFAQTPAPKDAPPATGGFNFGSAAPTFNFTAAAPKPDQATFNAPSTGNLFGQTMGPAKNGTFNFGSAASAAAPQKAGFSFGASPQTAPAPAAAQSANNSQMPMFNFGSAAAGVTNTSSTGFNFSGAPPVFDANAKPSFNFTDGSVTTFAAQPTDAAGITPQRKIRKALRRTQR